MSHGWKLSSLAPSASRYSLYFWLMKSYIASAVGNFTDWAINRSLSFGMPALASANWVFSWLSWRLLISESAMSIANRLSLVMSLSSSSAVFLSFRNASTMFVPAEPNPIMCRLFW